MCAALGGGIVAGWACDTPGMPTFRVHHIDHPEIEAEGRKPAESCGRLTALLVEAIDFAGKPGGASPSGWPSSMPVASTAPSPPARGPSPGCRFIPRSSVCGAAGPPPGAVIIEEETTHGTLPR
jgi:hypothetical protein